MKPSRFQPVNHRSKTRSMGKLPAWLLWVLLSLLVPSVGLHLIDLKIRPSIKVAAEAVAKRAAVEALNSALTEEIAKNGEDNDLVNIERGPKGEFRGLRFNMPLITKLQSEATDNARDHLRNLAHETFRLPFTQIMGGSVFASMSPSLPIKLVLLGTVHSSIVPDVQTVGINQTVHILYLDLTADVNVIAPFISSPVTVHTRAPLTYNVVSGIVPNSFYGGIPLPNSTNNGS